MQYQSFLLIFQFVATLLAVCPTVDNLLVTLVPGQEWRNVCETASANGHLHNYSVTLHTVSESWQRAQVRGVTGGSCYSDIPPDPRTGWDCLGAAYNCTQLTYTSQTPVCLILSNPPNNTLTLSFTVSISYDVSDAPDPLFPLQFYLQNTGQQNGTAGNDINILPVWAQNINGSGVVIDFVGDGLYINHQDVKDKVRLDLSYNYRSQRPDPTGGRWSRGTACAGIAAGTAGNNVCGKGAAYGAQLAAHRIPSRDPFAVALALYDTQHGNDTIDITSCLYCQIPACYGFSFCNYFPENHAANQALESGTLLGRKGRGRIYIMPAGGNTLTGNITNSDINMNPYSKQRQVISVVGTSNRGARDWNSDVGACILVNAPVSTVRNPILYRNTGGLAGRGLGVTTISTFSETGCTSNFRGGARTASALVAGVVALALQVHPNLSWREVQKLLILTADKNYPNSTSWMTNQAGYHYSRWYGFGRVNAAAVVEKAQEWAGELYQLGEERSFSTNTFKVDACIPDNANGPVVSVTAAETGVHEVESVSVVLNIQHKSIGDLTIYLTSPSGTTILLKNHTPSEVAHWATRVVNRFPLFVSDFVNYPLYARAFYGETGNGKWTLNISDTIANNITGVLTDWSLNLWGTGPGCFVSNNCTTQPTPTLQASSSSCDSGGGGSTSHTVAIVAGLVGGFVAGAVLMWWYFTAQRKAKAAQESREGLEAVLTADLDGEAPVLQ